MGVRIRNGNSISEGIKRIKGIESSYFKFPISFKYEDEIINMMTPFEIAKGVYSAEALSKRFGKQCVIGLLSKLEKSDHEATVEKVAPLINICNQKTKLLELEHIGEIGGGYSVSLAFYDVTGRG